MAMMIATVVKTTMAMVMTMVMVMLMRGRRGWGMEGIKTKVEVEKE